MIPFSWTKITSATMIVLLLLALLPAGVLYGQIQKKGAPLATTNNGSKTLIQWLDPETAYEQNKVNAKPFFIDVYTSWCGWCKRMDQTTFQDPVVAKYINTYFYPVKFNAETNDTINFLERQYVNSQKGYVANYLKDADSIIVSKNDSIKLLGMAPGEEALLAGVKSRLQITISGKAQMARKARKTTHDFAIDLMNKQMSYPTFVILFDSLRNNFPLKGYQKPTQLLSVLSFFSEGVYKQTNQLQDYRQLFYESIGQQLPPNKVWKSIKETSDSAAINRKKTLLLITNNSTYSSLVMEHAVCASDSVVAVLNENFNVAKLDLFSKDSVNFKGNVFKNHRGVHDLAASLMQTETKFPCLVVLDENQNLVFRIPGFFLPSDLVPALRFINQEIYKTKTSFYDFKTTYQNQLKK